MLVKKTFLWCNLSKKQSKSERKNIQVNFLFSIRQVVLFRNMQQQQKVYLKTLPQEDLNHDF